VASPVVMATTIVVNLNVFIVSFLVDIRLTVAVN